MRRGRILARRGAHVLTSRGLLGRFCAAISCKALVLEDLTGIRERVTVRHEQRYTLHSWVFFHLRAFLTYKAARADVACIWWIPGIPAAPARRVGIVSRQIGGRKRNSPASIAA